MGAWFAIIGLYSALLIVVPLVVAFLLCLAVLGAVGVAVAVAGRSLSWRMRFALGGLAVTALATFVVDQTAFGAAMINWFAD